MGVGSHDRIVVGSLGRGPLRFQQGGDTVTVQAPAYANLAPPGTNAVPRQVMDSCEPRERRSLSLDVSGVAAAGEPTRNVTMSHDGVQGRKTGRVRWQVRAIGCVLMGILCLSVLELSAYLYLRIFTGYDGEHLTSYRFDDYKNIQLTPGYRNTRGVFHNGQGFR